MRLNIAKHIYTVLSGTEAIASLVRDERTGDLNIYPVATKVERRFPLILFERDTVTPRYDKDGCAVTEFDATVFVVSETYTEGAEIAEMVIAALDRKPAEYEEFDVLDCVQTGAVEGFQDRAFVQQIQFMFITNPNK